MEADLLRWGHEYLLARPPDDLRIVYAVDPWRRERFRPGEESALEQWERLLANLRAAGAAVRALEAPRELPMMVFTANGGLVYGNRFVVARSRTRRRVAEGPVFADSFASDGYELVHLDANQDASFEGAGEALPFRGRFVAGYTHPDDLAAHRALARVLGVDVVSVELVDARFLHIDMTFCPLTDRRALVFADAWGPAGRDAMSRLVPEALVLEDDEASALCANSVVVGSTIVMPECPPRVGRVLERWGFDVCVSPVGEFRKLQGGVRCLTLALDVSPETIAPQPAAAPDGSRTPSDPALEASALEEGGR